MRSEAGNIWQHWTTQPRGVKWHHPTSNLSEPRGGMTNGALGLRRERQGLNICTPSLSLCLAQYGICRGGTKFETLPKYCISELFTHRHETVAFVWNRRFSYVWWNMQPWMTMTSIQVIGKCNFTQYWQQNLVLPHFRLWKNIIYCAAPRRTSPARIRLSSTAKKRVKFAW